MLEWSCAKHALTRLLFLTNTFFFEILQAWSYQIKSRVTAHNIFSLRNPKYEMMISVDSNKPSQNAAENNCTSMAVKNHIENRA